ncbi:hypothetical protein Ddye_025103 [Dipteronia dyeriana]|uniref:Uncharacterized protein n=1 Tax=Dipteronia dyeriana TaxID=168575 RepID=A0AAD9TW32_9ROSI|nr:hypothetical protein Ddye_025103 [Dipteronia dyeriana]
MAITNSQDDSSANAYITPFQTPSLKLIPIRRQENPFFNRKLARSLHTYGTRLWTRHLDL